MKIKTDSCSKIIIENFTMLMSRKSTNYLQAPRLNFPTDGHLLCFYLSDVNSIESTKDFPNDVIPAISVETQYNKVKCYIG